MLYHSEDLDEAEALACVRMKTNPHAGAATVGAEIARIACDEDTYSALFDLVVSLDPDHFLVLGCQANRAMISKEHAVAPCQKGMVFSRSGISELGSKRAKAK